MVVLGTLASCLSRNQLHPSKKGYLTSDRFNATAETHENLFSSSLNTGEDSCWLEGLFC